MDRHTLAIKGERQFKASGERVNPKLAMREPRNGYEFTITAPMQSMV